MTKIVLSSRTIKVKESYEYVQTRLNNGSAWIELTIEQLEYNENVEHKTMINKSQIVMFQSIS